jgi:curved DNA-binding protein
MAAQALISRKDARALLGVAAGAGEGDLRRAFREAAKTAHPDRPGGCADRFRQVVEAYHLLTAQPKTDDRFFQPPSAAPVSLADLLAISPLTAMNGGEVLHAFKDGRQIRLTLPAGLRAGDRVRADAIELEVVIRREGALLVRGGDLWMSLDVEKSVLEKGGRIAVDTPLGRRIVWINKQAGERGLVRLVGQGLPARAGHAQGHLFLRLTPQATSIDSAARALLRRFAAAWAA